MPGFTQKTMSNKTVVIYTTPSCPFCRQAEKFMQERDVEYTEYDVLEDQKRLEEMIDVSGQMGVPVLVVGGKVLLGFNSEALGKALDALK